MLYPWKSMNQMRVRTAIFSRFTQASLWSPTITVLAILCPIGAILALALPWRFAQVNDDYWWRPKLVAAAGAIITALAWATGFTPLVWWGSQIFNLLHGHPQIIPLLLMWMLGSLWGNAPLLIIAALLAWGRGAGLDITKRKYLEKVDTESRRYARLMERSIEELSDGDPSLAHEE